MSQPASSSPDQHDTTAEFHQIVMQQLAASAHELFANYGQELNLSVAQEEPKRRLNLSLGAAIGFTSTHVRGVLAIAVDEDLALRMNPLGAANQQQGGGHQDWIGELANQLLGRLKNKLLSCGVELALSTPVVVQGSDLRIGAVQRRATKLTFLGESNEADVWWDAEVDADLVLTEAEEEAQSEGEMVLF